MKTIIEFIKIRIRVINLQIERLKLLYLFIASTYLAATGMALGMAMPLILSVFLAIIVAPTKVNDKYDWWTAGGVLLAGLLVQILSLI